MSAEGSSVKVAASRVPPLSLRLRRLREGTHYFQARAHTYYRGVGK